MAHLFAYGTLMFPQVWNLLTGGTHLHRPALLKGFVRRRARGEVYPVMFPGDEEVTGTVYFDLLDDEMARLDAFEGTLYLRRTVQPLCDAAEPVIAQAYLLRPEFRDRAEGPWDPEWFMREGLRPFLRKYEGFRR